MASAKSETPGAQLESGLMAALRELRSLPGEGARDLPVLLGLSSASKSSFSENQENVILEAIRFLVDSGRIYLMGEDIVMEIPSSDPGGKRLIWLRQGRKVQSGAHSALANLFVCKGENGVFPPPQWFIQLVFLSELLEPRLPRIEHYSNRAAFGPNYEWLAPGWHPESRYLVHGADIEPHLGDAPDPSRPILERLPPAIRGLLGEFCFRAPADVANALSMLLTGLLAVPIASSRPIFQIDGNQPGLGKTLFVRAVGIVLDDAEPPVLAFTSNEEELRKVIIATLRGNCRSVLLFDNAKIAQGGAINSPAIEALSMAPEVTGRILGKSENFTRRNDFLWTITMNDYRASSDLVSRGAPVRLLYEGTPERRSFRGDPVAYAREHRAEIIGELAGMVEAWNQAGRPLAEARHRCHDWSKVIGGILQVNGFPEFLANFEEAAASFNAEFDQLSDLFEVCQTADGPCIDPAAVGSHMDCAARKLRPQAWIPYLRAAGILDNREPHAASGKRAEIAAGRFLGPKVGRKIDVEINGIAAHAILCCETWGGRKKYYFFEILWDDAHREDAPGEMLHCVRGVIGDSPQPSDEPPSSPIPPPDGGEIDLLF